MSQINSTYEPYLVPLGLLGAQLGLARPLDGVRDAALPEGAQGTLAPLLHGGHLGFSGGDRGSEDVVGGDEQERRGKRKFREMSHDSSSSQVSFVVSLCRVLDRAPCPAKADRKADEKERENKGAVM